jgi:hypothetical protein
MKLESSLQRSQQPATGLILSEQNPSRAMTSFVLLSSHSFAPDFPTKILCAYFIFPHVLHATQSHPLLFDFLNTIW